MAARRRKPSDLPIVVEPEGPTGFPIAPPPHVPRILGTARTPARLNSTELNEGFTDTAIAFGERQMAIAGAWKTRDRDPVILPAWMAEAPMWDHHRSASVLSTTRRVYTGRYSDQADRSQVKTAPLAIELHNPVSRRGPARAIGSPHGLLRYGDLDIVMAIMQQCLVRTTRSIEYEAGRLLEWLGKEPSEYPGAYASLRSSIFRLTTTQILIYLDGIEQHLQPEELPSPFTILVNDGSRPEKGVIKGKISDYMANDIARGNLWQLVDVKAYRHLMLTLPESGLTRVIYLFLSSLRGKDSNFSCPVDWLQERWGERVNGRYRYSSPYSRGSRISQALQELSAAGVMRLGVSEDGSKLTGVFADTTILPELPTRRMRSLPSFVYVPEMPTSTEEVVTKTVSMSAPAPAIPATSAGQPTPDPIHASVAMLNSRIKCSKSVMAKALKDGWTEIQQLHVMIEILHGHELGTVFSPGGLLAVLFVDRHPELYDHEPAEAVAWIARAPEWRELPWLMLRRAAAAARKTAAKERERESAPAVPPSAPAGATDEPRSSPAAPVKLATAPPDFVAAWNFALRQCESSSSIPNSNTWLSSKSHRLLGLDDGWLVDEVATPLIRYTMGKENRQFGSFLATVVQEALGSTFAIKGIRFHCTPKTKSAEADNAPQFVEVPMPKAR